MDDKARKQAKEQAFVTVAAAIARRRQRCPWNPFPADSPWGRQIDESYRMDLAEECRRRRIYPYPRGHRTLIGFTGGI